MEVPHLPSPSPPAVPGSTPDNQRIRHSLFDFLQNKAKILADLSFDSTIGPPSPGAALSVVAGVGTLVGGIVGFGFGFWMGGVSTALEAVPFGLLVGGALFGLAAVLIFFIAKVIWEIASFPTRRVWLLIWLSLEAVMHYVK